MNPNPEEFVSLTDSLHGALELNPEKKPSVGLAFRHYKEEYKKARKTHDAFSVAHHFQSLIDNDTKKRAKEATCRKGCSFCCRQEVIINLDEAELVLESAREKNYKIDWEKVKRQAETSSWKELSPEDKKCVFLSQNGQSEYGECSVYNYRPAACRKYFVVSNPELCDTEKNPGQKVARIFNLQAEILTTAMWNAQQSGSMPEVLLKAKK